jgi:tRNA(fMet)-specific endonuclease VapC
LHAWTSSNPKASLSLLSPSLNSTEGVYYSRDPEGDEQDLNNFLRGVTVLGLDEAIAKIFGRERGRLRTAGTLIGDLDLLIAATALHYNLTLLTNNRSHFERVEGLRMESV